MAGKSVRQICRHLFLTYLPLDWQWKIRSIRAKKAMVGKGSYIGKRVSLIGGSHIRIGDDCSIGEDSWLNVNGKSGNDPRIVIGNNSFIGRRNFFSSGDRIIISDYALTAVDCKFICATHLIDDPRLPYLDSGVSSDGLIKVGVNCFFGAATTVLGSVSIGHGSMIAALSLVTKDVPPFSVVMGNPATVRKRYSFRKAQWMDIGSVTAEDLLDNPGEEEYKKMISLTHPHLHLPLPAAGSSYGNT